MNSTEATPPAAHPIARSVLETAGVIAFTLVVLYAIVVVRYGSIQGCLSSWKGEPIAIDARLKDLGEMADGQKLSVPLGLTNLGTRPVLITGSQSTCTCTVADHIFPLEIKPGEKRIIPIAVTSRAADGEQFRQDVRFFTDQPNQPQVLLTVVGRLKGARPSP